MNWRNSRLPQINQKNTLQNQGILPALNQQHSFIQTLEQIEQALSSKKKEITFLENQMRQLEENWYRSDDPQEKVFLENQILGLYKQSRQLQWQRADNDESGGDYLLGPGPEPYKKKIEPIGKALGGGGGWWNKQSSISDPRLRGEIHRGLKSQLPLGFKADPPNNQPPYNSIGNSDLKNILENISPGKWVKAYKNGTVGGKNVTIHYFYNTDLHHVYNVKPTYGFTDRTNWYYSLIPFLLSPAPPSEEKFHTHTDSYSPYPTMSESGQLNYIQNIPSGFGSLGGGFGLNPAPYASPHYPH